MNSNFSQLQQIELDRLVDDELSATERRHLLAALEDQPDGWRRCALAFLEAQSWQGELGALVREADAPVGMRRREAPQAVAHVTPAPQKLHSMRLPRSSWWMSAAAILLVAFTVGWGLGQFVSPWPGLDPSAGQFAAVPQPPIQPPATRPEVSQQPDDASQQDEVLKLWVRDERGDPRTLDVPLVDADVLDRQWGVQFQSGVSADVRRQLEEQGFHVQTRRRYAPFWFDRERPLVMPVEDVQVVPVSRAVY